MEWLLKMWKAHYTAGVWFVHSRAALETVVQGLTDIAVLVLELDNVAPAPSL